MKLRITLLSDLCCSSGEAFGYIIDSDITFDNNGFPFIPSRRLKGCLREAADALTDSGILSKEAIDRLFGTPGGSGGSLILKNAVMENPHEQSDSDKNDRMAMYTSIRSQTKLTEAGNADDNFLRFTRVLNQYDPITKEPMTFTAEVLYDECDSTTLEIACKALKHIGLHRTRGLGVVKCELIPSEDDRSQEKIIDGLKGKYESFDKVRLSYTVRLTSPVTLPKHGGGIESHIGGNTVLGMFAGQYLKHISKDADETFSDLFLKNKVFWSPLYPSYKTSESYVTCYPAPLYLVKTKYTQDAESKYKNAYAEELDRQCQPKSLTGKYAAKTDDGYTFISPETQSIYHHSKNNPKRSADPAPQELYVQESLCENQFFSGEVIAERSQIDDILKLFKAADIAFGRSRTAQYASCALVAADIEEYRTDKIEIEKGEKLYAVLKTDLLLVNEKGLFDVSEEHVKNTIAAYWTHIKQLGCNCLYKTVAGFNTVWMLQKPIKRVVAAGSVYEFEATENLTVESELIIGENYREGFGKLALISEKQMQALKTVEKYDGNAPQPQKNGMEDIRNSARAYFYREKQILIKNFKEASFVGRVALMLKESGRLDNIKEDFKNRIESISTQSKRSSALQLYHSFEDLDGNEFFESVYIVLTLLKYELRVRKGG